MTCKINLATTFLLAVAAVDHAQTSSRLRLVKTVPMPDVQGRIDHMFFDAHSGRLFVAALGNSTVEIIDVAAGKRTQTIHGLYEPQGVL